MTTYFTFPVSGQLKEDIDTVLANLDGNVAAPQWELYVKTSIEYTDAVIQVLLLDMVHALGTKSGVLEQLAGMIKGTVHVLIRQVLGKMSNDDLRKAAVYLHERRLVIDGQTYIAVPIADSLRTKLDTVFEETDAGNGEGNTLVLRDAMIEFTDQAIAGYYDDFIKHLKLGFIASKAVSLGRSTIVKGAHAAMNKMIPHLRQQEMKGFADYFGPHLKSL